VRRRSRREAGTADAEAREQGFALVNGRILGLNAANATLARSRATALLLENGRIQEIGDDRTILARVRGRGGALDLQGAVLAPGFIDAHIHAFDCALGSLKVSCLPPAVDSLTALKRRLAERAASTPVGDWVVGEGYDDMRLAERRHPDRHDLDEAVPDHPAVVTRVCGHMSVANTRALAAAGLNGGTTNPTGGVIVRDAAGELTGLLLEEAQDIVVNAVPPADASEIARALARVAERLVAHGVTTICEALLGAFHPHEPHIWAQVLSDDWRGPRVRFLADPQIVEGGSDRGLPVIGTKLFADGVITGRTAALSQPFEGGDDAGMLIHEPGRLEELVERSVARGLPVGIHAMGDRGISAAVAAIEHVCGPAEEPTRGKGASTGSRLPHRIEHCTLPGSSLGTIRALGIVPVPQPVFLYAEGEAYRAQLGDERSAVAYPLRTMIGGGLRPALSSDAPATSSEDAMDPWLGLRAAVTRGTWAGNQLGSDETISVGRAMACYTVNGASALGLEDRTGSIEVGKDADLVVLPGDPLTADADSLVTLRPEMVFVKGRRVHGSLPDL
jgi:predicted amidohydrolase YtcJ